ELALGGVEVDDLDAVADRPRLDDLARNADPGHQDVAVLVLDARILRDHGDDPPGLPAVARHWFRLLGHRVLPVCRPRACARKCSSARPGPPRSCECGGALDNHNSMSIIQ